MKNYIQITILAVSFIALMFYTISLENQLWKEKLEKGKWFEATIGLFYGTESDTPGLQKLHSVQTPEDLKRFVTQYATESRKK